MVTALVIIPDGSTMKPTYESLLEIFQGRRSVRRFEDRPIPEALIEQLLEAARWAPSAGNRQPHRFLAITSREAIGRMAAAVREVSERLREQLRAERGLEAGAYLDHFAHFAGAPLVVVPLYRAGFDLRQAVSGSAGGAAGETDVPGADALASVAAATMNLLLAAHVLGLGACWMTGPLVARKALAALLAVPRGWAIAAVVPVGFPAEVPAPPSRRPLAQLVRRIDGGESG